MRAYRATRLRRGDGSALPVRSQTIDFVCLRFVLQHTARRGTILAEAHRVLKPGGLIWVCESDFTQLTSIHHTARSKRS